MERSLLLINRSRISKEWEVTSLVVLRPVASSESKEKTTDGQTSSTKRLTKLPDGGSPSVELLTPQASSSRKSVSRPNSPTPVFVSASVSSSKKTIRESPVSCLVTVACHSATKTMKFLLPVSVVQVTQSVICPVSAS